jgi:hypothetical protein
VSTDAFVSDKIAITETGEIKIGISKYSNVKSSFVFWIHKQIQNQDQNEMK